MNRPRNFPELFHKSAASLVIRSVLVSLLVILYWSSHHIHTWSRWYRCYSGTSIGDVLSQKFYEEKESNRL